MRHLLVNTFRVFLAVTFLGLFSTSLWAQDVPEIQLETFRPATGPTDYLALHSSLSAPHLEFDFGAYLDFANDRLNPGSSCKQPSKPEGWKVFSE